MLPLVPVALLLASTLTVDSSIPDEPGQDPLAPAQSGMVQCYGPDVASHTCSLIYVFHRGHDGSWIRTATILPDQSQPMTVAVDTPVTVRQSAVCGTFRRDQVMMAKLSYFERQVPADRALPFLTQIADAMAGAFDREICTRFLTVGGVLMARPFMTDKNIQFPDQRVIWVRADAGYRVQPRANKG